MAVRSGKKDVSSQTPNPSLSYTIPFLPSSGATSYIILITSSHGTISSTGVISVHENLSVNCMHGIVCQKFSGAMKNADNDWWEHDPANLLECDQCLDGTALGNPM